MSIRIVNNHRITSKGGKYVVRAVVCPISMLIGLKIKNPFEMRRNPAL